jgi:hypothetical protein
MKNLKMVGVESKYDIIIDIGGAAGMIMFLLRIISNTATSLHQCVACNNYRYYSQCSNRKELIFTCHKHLAGVMQRSRPRVVAEGADSPNVGLEFGTVFQVREKLTVINGESCVGRIGIQWEFNYSEYTIKNVI